MTLTRPRRRKHARHEQGTGHHSRRDPGASGASTSYRGPFRGGGQYGSDRPRGEEARESWTAVARPDAGPSDLGDEHRRDPGPDSREELSSVLVDSNVLLDVVTEDPRWG